MSLHPQDTSTRCDQVLAWVNDAIIFVQLDTQDSKNQLRSSIKAIEEWKEGSAIFEDKKLEDLVSLLKNFINSPKGNQHSDSEKVLDEIQRLFEANVPADS